MGNAQTGGTAHNVQSWKELHGPAGLAKPLPCHTSTQLLCVALGSVEYTALEELLRNVRSDRVRAEFFKVPETQYTDMNEVRIWASTFNLNGRKPPDDLDLSGYVEHWQSSWPQREKAVGDGSHERADIYVMGFQEAVPLTAQNVIAGWTAAPAGWDNAIDRCLNPWKTEDEILHSPKRENPNEANVIDYYVSGWSGVPSANLESRMKASLAEGSSMRGAMLKRSSSMDEKTRKMGNTQSGFKSVDLNEADLISFDEPAQDQSKQKPSKGREAFKQASQAHREKKKEPVHEEFLQLFGHQLVGLYVTGWVRKSFIKRISGVQITTVATGALGYLANKGILSTSKERSETVMDIGAIAIRLRIDDSAFVFVTSHLASGSAEGDQIRRNLDFSEIVRRTQFPFEVDLVQVTREDGTLVEDFSVRPDGIPENASYDVKRAFVGGKWGSLRSLRDLDNIIWVGDLNYRINARAEDVIQLIRADRLNLLLEVDQLSVERAAGKVFQVGFSLFHPGRIACSLQNFVEAPIDFPPTYKFIRGTAYYTGEIEAESSSDSEIEFDLSRPSETLTKAIESHPVENDFTSSAPVRPTESPPTPLEKSDSAPDTGRVPKARSSTGDMPVGQKEEKQKKGKGKIRTPSWTDRILWYSSKKQLHQLLYGCFSPIAVSDHKPVVATFLMETRKFNLDKVEAALQEARRHIDVEEMASIPRCKLSPTVLEVGNVAYGRPVECDITLYNVGEVSAVYSFIPANPGRHVIRSPFPTWLSAQPTSGVVKAGKTEHIKLSVSIEGGQWGSADELFGDPEKKLDHILVLHVEGGSDFFVSIIGSYTLSCFGLSLNNLAMHLPQNQQKLHRGRVMRKVSLPSMKYREHQTGVVNWEVPVKEDCTVDLDDHVVARASGEEQALLLHSNSVAATGPQPNLLEGPTGLMIPSQVSRMLLFLADEERLKTPHLFVESYKQICKSAVGKTTLAAVAGVRDALDQSKGFPHGTTAHDMASALLTFFLDLPSPMIPESIAQNCEMSDISAVMAMSLVREAMSAIEWSVFDSTLEIMRSALTDENVKKNRLTEEALARVVSQVFFQDIDKSEGSSKLHFMESSDASAGRRGIVDHRRCLFMRQFLKYDKPLIDLDEAEASVSEMSYKST